MKRIFTLAFVALLFTQTSNAQSQNFNSAGILNDLQSSCWNFYGFAETTAAPVISGARHLYVLPTTSTDNNPQSNSNVGQIATPYLNFTATTTVRFSYRLQSRLSNNAKRFMTLRLYNGSTSQVLQTITLDRNTPLTVQTTGDMVIPAGNGIKRLVIDFTGDGDGNTGMFFDELLINGATYAYTSSCGASSSIGIITLPIKLLSFTAGMVANRSALLWSVAENESGNFFEIQQSADGREFRAFATVFATDKAGSEQYSFKTDHRTSPVYFRLKLTSKDGSVTYSSVVEMKTEAVATGALQVWQNPGAARLSVQAELSAGGSYTATVYNTSGTRLQQTTLACNKGRNSLTLPLQVQQNGFYILEISNGNERYTAKFAKR